MPEISELRELRYTATTAFIAGVGGNLSFPAIVSKLQGPADDNGGNEYHGCRALPYQHKTLRSGESPMTTVSGYKRLMYGLCISAALAASGCQVNVGGQSLPSPYYLTDDVQYFAPGPEFSLAREAATQQVRQAENAGLDELGQPGN